MTEEKSQPLSDPSPEEQAQADLPTAAQASALPDAAAAQASALPDAAADQASALPDAAADQASALPDAAATSEETDVAPPVSSEKGASSADATTDATAVAAGQNAPQREEAVPSKRKKINKMKLEEVSAALKRTEAKMFNLNSRYAQALLIRKAELERQ